MEDKNKQVSTGAKVDVKKSKKNKKPNVFKRMGKKLKEVFSEIKKVTWPSPKTVVKQTAIVLGVVLILASVVSVVSGRFIDRLGKLRFGSGEKN